MAEQYAIAPAETVTFATLDYFSAATEADKKTKSVKSTHALRCGRSLRTGSLTDPTCSTTWNAQEFDWTGTAVNGGSGVLVEEFQAWEGGLVFTGTPLAERCAYSDVDLNLFQGMRFGFGVGP